jgi:hypothetical protein
MKSATARIVCLALLWTSPTAASDVEMETSSGAFGDASATAAAEPSAPIGEVVRSTFTTGVVNREPQDSVTQLTNDNVQVMFFTELRDMSGETITHRWEHAGAVVAEVPFDVGGPRWRVYSAKSLDPNWIGEWKVTVVDSAGHVLDQDAFTLVEAPAAPAAPVADAVSELPTEASTPAAPSP